MRHPWRSLSLKAVFIGSLLGIALLYFTLFNISPNWIMDVGYSTRNLEKHLVIVLGGLGQHQLHRWLLRHNETKNNPPQEGQGGGGGGGGFQWIARNGVRAEFVNPVFPTLAQPNQFSIFTGLYAEDHGIVANVLYSPENQELLKMKDYSKAFDQLLPDGLLPVWLSAEKNSGRKIGRYTDSSCTRSTGGGPIAAVAPVLSRPWESDNEPQSAAADSTTPNDHDDRWPDMEEEEEEEEDMRDGDMAAVDCFVNNLREALAQLDQSNYDMAIVHTEVIDRLSESHGPFADPVWDAVRNIDAALKNLVDRIGQLDKRHLINVLVLSDRGRVSSKGFQPVELNHSALEENDIHKMILDGVHLQIWPNHDKTNKVHTALQTLDGLHSWTLDTIPRDFHCKHNDRIAPIQATAKKGFFIRLHPHMNGSKVIGPENGHPNHSPAAGLDGYDPQEVEEMRAIFMATGYTNFHENVILPPLQMADVYNVMAVLLRQDPVLPLGSWNNLQRALRRTWKREKTFAQNIRQNHFHGSS